MSLCLPAIHMPAVYRLIFPLNIRPANSLKSFSPFTYPLACPSVRPYVFPSTFQHNLSIHQENANKHNNTNPWAPTRPAGLPRSTARPAGLPRSTEYLHSPSERSTAADDASCQPVQSKHSAPLDAPRRLSIVSHSARL